MPVFLLYDISKIQMIIPIILFNCIPIADKIRYYDNENKSACDLSIFVWMREFCIVILPNADLSYRDIETAIQ